MSIRITLCKLLRDKEDGCSNLYTIEDMPKSLEPLLKEIIREKFDYVSFKRDTGIDLNTCKIIKQSIVDNDVEWIVKDTEGELHKIFTSSIPKIRYSIKGLYIDNIATMSHCFNPNFYEDLKRQAIPIVIWSKEELRKFKDSYISKQYIETFEKCIFTLYEDNKTCVTIL